MWYLSIAGGFSRLIRMAVCTLHEGLDKVRSTTVYLSLR